VSRGRCTSSRPAAALAPSTRVVIGAPFPVSHAFVGNTCSYPMPARMAEVSDPGSAPARKVLRRCGQGTHRAGPPRSPPMTMASETGGGNLPCRLHNASTTGGDSRGLGGTGGECEGVGNRRFYNPMRPKSRGANRLGFPPQTGSIPAASNSFCPMMLCLLSRPSPRFRTSLSPRLSSSGAPGPVAAASVGRGLREPRSRLESAAVVIDI
jgi:hypothetical protein